MRSEEPFTRTPQVGSLLDAWRDGAQTARAGGSVAAGPAVTRSATPRERLQALWWFRGWYHGATNFGSRAPSQEMPSRPNGRAARSQVPGPS